VLIRYYELRQLDVRDDDGGLTVLRLLVAVLAEAFRGLAFICAAKGFCVNLDRLPTIDILLATFLNLSATVLWRVPQYLNLHSLELPAFMLAALSGALFFREVLLSLSDSILRCWIHLLAIMRAGIDPKSTPVYQQFTMLRSFKIIFVCYAAIVGLHILIRIFVSIWYWADESISDLITLFILVMSGVIFRVRRSDVGGKYGFVSEIDGDRGGEPGLGSLDLRAGKLVSGGLEWHPGMWIPVGPTEAGTHYGNVRTRGREDSIDITVIDDMSLDDDPLTASG
jgi:hypothetical protein